MIKEFRRQPRFLPYMPSGEIEIPNPPGQPGKPEFNWFTIIVPPVVMMIVTVIIALALKSSFIIFSVIATIMSLIVSLSNISSQIKKYKKMKKEREGKYLQFIADTRNELLLAKEQQTKAMHEMHPEPDECIQRMLRVDNRLWEKVPTYNDFLCIRLGLGSAPLNISIKYNKQTIILENDPLLMEPQRLAFEFQKINDVPVLVNLVESVITGIAGDEERVFELVKNILIQIITHHGYDDVKIVVLASSKNLAQWTWLSFLPHVWNDSFSVRFILCGRAMAHQTLSELYSELKAREFRASTGAVFSRYVFFVEDPALLENEPISKYLYSDSESSKVGVSSIFIAHNKAYLPMNCKTVINIEGKLAEKAERLTGEKVTFVPDKADHKNLDIAVRKMAALRIKSSYDEYALPDSLSFLDMLKVKHVEEIDVLSQWYKNRTYQGMKVPLGAKAGGEAFYIDLHETGYGPHGLIAGTTGSGKSELIQSLILSLALHYHPHDVVFVLIDYKGGGTADAFKDLPHLVGTITNLSGNMTTRALLSIKSELMRRQRIFSQYGVNNIDKYQKLYYMSKTSEGNPEMPSVPHLIIIADEFAELKQDQPEFMKELISTARVGRSLGVHLILATQKPAGIVDDQIWSNSKFKICLKVQDEKDSKDVIKRPDAAMIKEPGRAYIQVGNDEIFEIFQSAYSGADYDPEGVMQKSENKVRRIYKIALDGKAEQIYPAFEDKTLDKEMPSQLASLVKYLDETAQKAGIPRLEGPWKPPLPETLYLDDIISGITLDGKLLSVPIGLADDPRNQRQEVLCLDFDVGNNLIIYGAPATGKTSLLKTICLSLAHFYTPEDVNIYIMDFGGTSLKIFEKLPHCGEFITLEQEDKINQFMVFLERIIKRRKEAFEESGCDNFRTYRNRGYKLPVILLIIDNYHALSETYEQVDEKIVTLSREGAKYGIYLIVTCSNTSMIRYRFAVNFKMAICFQMTDKSEYINIVGRTDGLEPANIPGRGLVRGNPPLEFHVALPEYRDCSIEEIIKNIRAKETTKAESVPIMPERIDIKAINKKKGLLAIGLCDFDLQPVYIDFSTYPVFLLAGEPMSGKSTFLSAWIRALDGSKVYAVDSSNMSLLKVLGLPHVTNITNADETLVEEIEEILNSRRDELIHCSLNNGNVSELYNSWEQIIFVIDRLSEFVENGHTSWLRLIERIVRKERGLKVSVVASDNISDLMSNYHQLCKVFKEEQTGVLIGNIRDQSLFQLRLPFGMAEKEPSFGDGYFISKNKYIGLRLAV